MPAHTIALGHEAQKIVKPAVIPGAPSIALVERPICEPARKAVGVTWFPEAACEPAVRAVEVYVGPNLLVSQPTPTGVQIALVARVESGRAIINPKGKATRAEVAAMLHRFITAIEK